MFWLAKSVIQPQSNWSCISFAADWKPPRRKIRSEMVDALARHQNIAMQDSRVCRCLWTVEDCATKSLTWCLFTCPIKFPAAQKLCITKKTNKKNALFLHCSFGVNLLELKLRVRQTRSAGSLRQMTWGWTNCAARSGIVVSHCECRHIQRTAGTFPPLQ